MNPCSRPTRKPDSTTPTSAPTTPCSSSSPPTDRPPTVARWTTASSPARRTTRPGAGSSTTGCRPWPTNWRSCGPSTTTRRAASGWRRSSPGTRRAIPRTSPASPDPTARARPPSSPSTNPSGWWPSPGPTTWCATRSTHPCGNASRKTCCARPPPSSSPRSISVSTTSSAGTTPLSPRWASAWMWRNGKSWPSTTTTDSATSWRKACAPMACGGRDRRATTSTRWPR